ncbi:unnamed protein product [Sphagnum compactum]
MGSATGSFTRLNKRLAQQEAALNPSALMNAGITVRKSTSSAVGIIGRHLTNARDENNKAQCCDGDQQHVACIGCIHISTPNTTPVHTHTGHICAHTQ